MKRDGDVWVRSAGNERTMVLRPEKVSRQPIVGSLVKRNGNLNMEALFVKRRPVGGSLWKSVAVRGGMLGVKLGEQRIGGE